jgi:hypothetical protein
MQHLVDKLLSFGEDLVRRVYCGGRYLALVLLTSVSLILGTPVFFESFEGATDCSCECESVECLAVCPATPHHRRDTSQGWTVRLASHGGNATRAGQRMTAAPLSGHRLANGLSAPIRC